jgi:hypothetical protein
MYRDYNTAESSCQVLDTKQWIRDDEYKTIYPRQKSPTKYKTIYMGRKTKSTLKVP